MKQNALTISNDIDDHTRRCKEKEREAGRVVDGKKVGERTRNRPG